MPDPKNFDLDFRPRSYWGPASLEKHFGSTIQGEVRRKLVRENLEQGIEPAPGLLTPELSEPNRDAFGSIHPHFMGGEYLPGMEDDEVEIGRAVLDSVTRDVISIRARRKERLIQYSVVDEYEGDYEYKANPETSEEPLTFRELIQLVDGARPNGLDGDARQQNYEIDGSPDELSHFCTLSSVFYPELESWYEAKNDEWLAEQIKLLREQGWGDDDEEP